MYSIHTDTYTATALHRKPNSSEHYDNIIAYSSAYFSLQPFNEGVVTLWNTGQHKTGVRLYHHSCAVFVDFRLSKGVIISMTFWPQDNSWKFHNIYTGRVTMLTNNTGTLPKAIYCKCFLLSMGRRNTSTRFYDNELLRTIMHTISLDSG